ncbi:DNA-binding protein [Prevotella sp. E15-22]|nr:DNA-binding protein [Prevotella sp. E15-22]
MYKRAKKNMVPSHKMGRKVYFLKSEIVAFIRNN